MALMCPRCGTDVPSEALYCPYCSLPKPKRGFSSASEEAEATPSEQPKRATATKAKESSPKSIKRGARNSNKQPRKLRVSILSVAVLVAVLGVGGYIFVVPMVYSEEAEPKTILAALDKLRKMPSDEPTLTIDARLSRQLETARRVGNLASYQGWIVRPIKGTKTKVVLAFSYTEVGNISHSAEWIADLNTSTFTPQNELAILVSSK